MSRIELCQFAKYSFLTVFSRDVGISLIAVIVILMIAMVITPVILVCLFKQWLQRKKLNQPDPASLTPCAAYGVHTHGDSAEYEVPSPHSIPGKEPDYEMTNEQQYEVIPQAPPITIK